jgi:hypothetical protein
MSDADLERDIESTRQALGDTVEALAHKADVKARVGEKVDERKAELRRSINNVRSRVGGTAEHLGRPPGRIVVLVLSASAAAVVAVALVRRRRR